MYNIIKSVVRSTTCRIFLPAVFCPSKYLCQLASQIGRCLMEYITAVYKATKEICQCLFYFSLPRAGQIRICISLFAYILESFINANSQMLFCFPQGPQSCLFLHITVIRSWMTVKIPQSGMADQVASLYPLTWPHLDSATV